MSHEDYDPDRSNGSSTRRSPSFAAVLRMDLKGSSDAAKKDISSFMYLTARLRKQIDHSKYPSLLGGNEGEGDSIRAAFTDVREALRCAFFLRHAAQQPIEAADGLYILAARTVLHFDEFRESEDRRIEGVGQILVTRLDHAVQPGEILATEAFTRAALQVGVDKKGYSFAYVGQRELDKNEGKHPCYTVTLTGDGGSSSSYGPFYDPVELATRLFSQGDPSSQASAVEVLGTYDSEAAAHFLVNVALDVKVERRVQDAALMRLQERDNDINASDVSKILERFKDNAVPVETRALLLLALGATDHQDVPRTLSAVAKDDQMPARLREAAMLAMRNFNGSIIGNSVECALRGSDENLVRIAACVTAAAKPDSMTKNVPVLLKDIVEDNDLPMSLRNVACEALASQSTGGSLMETLAGLVENRAYPLTLRRYAIDGLGRSGTPSAVRAVEEVARRMDDDLRVDAMIALSGMRIPQRRVHRRTQAPPSHAAEVVDMRTRPQRRGA